MHETNDNINPLSINIVEEQIKVSSQFVEKAKVKITKKVHEEETAVNLSSAAEEVQIHTVSINQYVDATPPVRYEDDTIIIPVVKEVLIIQKKLMLVEELHVKKQIVVKEEQQTITLKKEEVIIERIPLINSNNS